MRKKIKGLILFLGAEIFYCWSFSTIEAARAQSHTLGPTFLFHTLSQCCFWDPSQPLAPALPSTLLYCKPDSRALNMWLIRQQSEFITTTQWFLGQLKCTKLNVHLQKVKFCFSLREEYLGAPLTKKWVFI